MLGEWLVFLVCYLPANERNSTMIDGPASLRDLKFVSHYPQNWNAPSPSFFCKQARTFSFSVFVQKFEQNSESTSKNILERNQDKETNTRTKDKRVR